MTVPYDKTFEDKPIMKFQSENHGKSSSQPSELGCQNIRRVVTACGQNEIADVSEYLGTEKGDSGDHFSERHQRRSKEGGGVKRSQRCCCCGIYMLALISIVAITVGGVVIALVYLGVIRTEKNLVAADNDQSYTNTTVTSPPTEIEDRSDGCPKDEVQEMMIPDEHAIIREMLSSRFHISFDNTDDLKAVNQAIDWMAKELKLFPSHGGLDNDNQVSSYSDITKFGQRFALLTLQYSLLGSMFGHDATTVRNLWQRQEGVDECNWNGVTCDSNGQVIVVDYSDKILTGSIAKQISLLEKIQILDLSSNMIVGTIPDEMYALSTLRRVYLYQNKLKGTISTLIGRLNSLEYFHLSQNSLTGPIPEQLRSWSHGVLRPLKYFNVYDNKLTGTIPDNLGLRNLFYFDIGRNFIVGSIPEDIGEDFNELRYLHVDHNRLTFSIPDTIPPMADGRLISFLADHNRFIGAVPDNWAMFNKLVQYTLHYNYFDYLGPNNCNFNVFGGGQLVEFKADCDICSCNDIFCDEMCSPSEL